MGTRCTISIKDEQGTQGVYCHWDGDPEHMMPILTQHYGTEEQVRALLALGDLSSLGERLAPEEGERHTFDRPLKGVTVAYHRDRGCEPLTEATSAKPPAGHYHYIFHCAKAQWVCAD